MGDAKDDQTLLAAALSGDPIATRELVDTLLPVVQCRVARVLRQRAPGNRDLRQEMQDLVQDVFARLFANRAQVLRQWDPERGANLRTFVSLVTHREVISKMRTAKRNPFTEEPTARSEHQLQPSPRPLPDQQASDREYLGQLVASLKAELSPQGYRVFQMLWGEQRAVEDVCASLNLSRDAVYAWRTRIRKLARQLAAHSPATAEGSA